MLSISSQELVGLVAAFLWPLTRILGFIVVAPPFGNNGVPPLVKIALGVMLSLIVAPTLQLPPQLDMVSLTGIMILLQQFVIGLAMGFMVRVIMAGVEMAGEVAGLTMGLGFATFFDPQTRGRSTAISQFLVIITTLIILSLNIHLAMFEALVMSFKTIPISTSLEMGFSPYTLAKWGEEIFKLGMVLSLPIVAALLIANIALGILTRAAPQLNLFGIGFPITITVGYVMLGLVLPYLLPALEGSFRHLIDALNGLGQHGK
ncbi:flagellar biosynthetic protein FliR [Undibacterium cyanobacteriorum]|uniref:Flagellar biosynthetic protein FliR n=1 Tax=Undibacterium cyanobacteriorum TaxID=3073561 RepID=A0ABY9RLW6_9BURK|nr:flagellar biosynthetic protein FliR [Undibacterium sp. 20NA77.5]WMW82207.1 flagellar biosynthetic protein FliR [Undibacterium sp. 20NA77.5]